MRDDEVETGSLGYFGGEISPVASRRARPGGVRHARSGWQRVELDKANRECYKPMPLFHRVAMQAGVLARGSQERWLVCRQKKKKKKRLLKAASHIQYKKACQANAQSVVCSRFSSYFLIIASVSIPHLHLPAHRLARHPDHSSPVRASVFSTGGLVFRYSQHVFGLAGDKGTRRQGLLLQCPYQGDAMDQAAGDDEPGGGTYIDLFIDSLFFFSLFLFISFHFFFIHLITFFFFLLFLFSFFFFTLFLLSSFLPFFLSFSLFFFTLLHVFHVFPSFSSFFHYFPLSRS